MGGVMGKTHQVVSKGEYVSYLGKLTALSWTGYLLALIGVLGLFISPFALVEATFGVPHVEAVRSSTYSVLLTGTMFLAVGSFLGLGRLGSRLVDRAEALQPMQPLTVRTVKRMPVSECLVRSSSEPAAQQSKVLLRPGRRQERIAPEEMLRPEETGLRRL